MPTINCRIPALDEVPPEGDGFALNYLSDATREEAFNQGSWAFCLGHEIDTNPYGEMTFQWAWWKEGWRDSNRTNG